MEIKLTKDELTVLKCLHGRAKWANTDAGIVAREGILKQTKIGADRLSRATSLLFCLGLLGWKATANRGTENQQIDWYWLTSQGVIAYRNSTHQDEWDTTTGEPEPVEPAIPEISGEKLTREVGFIPLPEPPSA